MADRTAAAQALLGKLDYRFSNPALFEEALTHRSALSRHANRKGQQKGAGSNERLEFVGDRVLGLVMAQWLFERHPQDQEGALGGRHGYLVSRPVLAEVASAIGLPAALHVASHEEEAGVLKRDTVRADAMEALLGAVFLDGGLEPARSIVRRLWQTHVEEEKKPHKEPKTRLQEHLLGKAQGLPDYVVLSSEGPSHKPVFRVEVRGGGQRAEGVAGSKRAAETEAASALLAKLEGGAPQDPA
ncbi:ribonuclease III [Formicincola oecophyllae]|uniref:Ribonuclease 3 n=1 Tax=Formicincola oecophyllae TaxID=2558361 RepID=A0A4Y6UAA5_9PROT|nr:ribonuclease III [Formicincola oecophyllae]QDH13880.1 ribonuclease III [Formicincola oecophyllae]